MSWPPAADLCAARAVILCGLRVKMLITPPFTQLGSTCLLLSRLPVIFCLSLFKLLIKQNQLQQKLYQKIRKKKKKEKRKQQMNPQQLQRKYSLIHSTNTDSVRMYVCVFSVDSGCCWISLSWLPAYSGSVHLFVYHILS